jgi:hypothetical protein
MASGLFVVELLLEAAAAKQRRINIVSIEKVVIERCHLLTTSMSYVNNKQTTTLIHLDFLTNERGESFVFVQCVRVRPLNEREQSDGSSSADLPWIWEQDTIGQVTNSSVSGTSAGTTFTFDNVFAPQSDTADLFDLVAKPIVDAVVAGVNGTIFAYGQTSSGKT